MTRGKWDALVERALGHFVRWDGVYFAAIARDGYTYEHFGAFFPLYPLLVRLLARGVHALAFGALQPASCVVLAGFALSNTCFVLAALALRALGTAVLRRPAVADRAALLFCLSPASIFFSALYTESLFALLSFLGMWFLARGCSSSSSSSSSSTSTSSSAPATTTPAPLQRLCDVTAATLAFALATATRSNGAVSCGFLLYAAAATVLPLDRLLLSAPRHTLAALTTLARSRPARRRALAALVVAALACALVLAPIAGVQAHGARLWCHAAGETTTTIPEWCRARVPNFYGHVQAAYWHQGFLRYWRAEQLPNFALYAPMLALVAHGTIAFVTAPAHRRDSRALVYVVHAAALALFALLCMHVQVGTRLLAAASPAVYWYAAALTTASRPAAALVLSYFASFFVVGTLLFTNFYPWT